MIDRRTRLQNLLLPLAQLPQFAWAEVTQLTREANAAFITSTLNDAIRADLLEKHADADQTVYRWRPANPPGEVSAWIDRLIHGDQVKQLPQGERPRERLLSDGPAGLPTADLLAILIRVGVKNESAITGGRKLANRFADKLEDLRRATADELKSFSPAITKPAYCQIMAGIELGRRIAAAETDRGPELTRITSTVEAIEYCRRKFGRLANDGVQEEFHIVTLDTKHKPIATHRITVGTLDASLVHPREVFRAAIRDSAAAVLLVHNHPSGDPTPSREDHQVTKRLTEAGDLIGILVLDHIVVARDRSVSLRELG